MLIGGNTELLKPTNIYPSDANMAIGTPHAADVPILVVRLRPELLK